MALSTEIDDLPYQFPEGLRVFVIDHDTTQLNAIVDMCFQCNYQVMTCTVASFAVHLLRETKGRCFDVILIEAQMPDMDSYEFLRRVTQEIKIPVIMMSVEYTASARVKAIEKGAFDYWLKPLNVNHINYMRQHVATFQQHDQIQRILEVKTAQKLMKRDEESATKETNACVLETKNNRVSWRSPRLQEQFLRAVNQLGIDKATPKKITELMDVPGLDRKHVASHLQKYRLRLKSSSKKTKSKSGRENSKQDQYHVPNESLEVVESMPEQDQKCDNNFHAQQQHPMVFDEFDLSNILTNETNMMLYEAWYPSKEYDSIDHYFE
ncbi:hypothetical protein TSUD_57860 [Trifolium subterraneum]|uniref:Response regulatory domain-containing protein n=1 Tax=Trifolium subterraneum TaxID=3900 RepID=A0A2Z6N2Y8_TRISU|nr:hypothetical protein TSUD_57860 [Trifolium subterraneum]